jgi:hypothetical protein
MDLTDFVRCDDIDGVYIRFLFPFGTYICIITG